jgi:alpha-amylase
MPFGSTPIVEQIHDGVDRRNRFKLWLSWLLGRDWTNLDPNFGTKED